MVYGAPSMRTRTALVGVLWLIASCAVVPTVVGDGTGSGISSAAGSYLLTPVGTNNYTLHAYLADLGMPIYRGTPSSTRGRRTAGPARPSTLKSTPIRSRGATSSTTTRRRLRSATAPGRLRRRTDTWSTG